MAIFCLAHFALVASLLPATVALLPTMTVPETSFMVEACAKAGSGLSSDQSTGLTSRGFTKCVFGAFDVLVAGSATYPDAYLLMTANIIAGILDQDADGVADDPAVMEALSFKHQASPPVMQGGVTEAEESRGDTLEESGFKYAFSLQTWKGPTVDYNIGVIVEEVFHMVTAEGYGVAYPAQFSMNSWDSVACQEMAAAECVTWHHMENTCEKPGSMWEAPPLEGTCSDPGCDCNEWFHQVALILAGMEPIWRSDLLPTTKTALEATLSTTFKDMMANEMYHQLKKPLTYKYTVTPQGDGDGDDDGDGGDDDDEDDDEDDADADGDGDDDGDDEDDGHDDDDGEDDDDDDTEAACATFGNPNDSCNPEEDSEHAICFNDGQPDEHTCVYNENGDFICQQTDNCDFDGVQSVDETNAVMNTMAMKPPPSHVSGSGTMASVCAASIFVVVGFVGYRHRRVVDETATCQPAYTQYRAVDMEDI